jgi:hypothetical protein
MSPSMLTFHDRLRDARMPITLAAGDMFGVGLVLLADAGPFTCARVLVVGDLVRRVLEDVHSVQELAAVITDDRVAVDAAWRPGLMVRPPIGVFTTRAGAEVDLGKPLDLVVTAAVSQDEPALRPPAVEVAPVRAAVPYPGADPATVRFAFARVPYARQLKVTSSLLVRCQVTLDRWREHVDEWSRHPGRPIPPAWRTAVIADLDDDLDVPAAVAKMAELEDAEGIELGAKFEAFAYLDRVVAVDLMRGVGRIRR